MILSTILTRIVKLKTAPLLFAKTYRKVNELNFFRSRLNPAVILYQIQALWATKLSYFWTSKVTSLVNFWLCQHYFENLKSPVFLKGTKNKYLSSFLPKTRPLIRQTAQSEVSFLGEKQLLIYSCVLLIQKTVTLVVFSTKLFEIESLIFFSHQTL